MKWRLRQWARTPFPLALDDSRSVLAVKGPLSPLRALDCCGPIRRGALFTREKGRSGAQEARERLDSAPWRKLSRVLGWVLLSSRFPRSAAV